MKKGLNEWVIEMVMTRLTAC